jgi:sortase B
MSKSGKGKKKNSKIFIIIFIACIAVAAYAGFRLISIGLSYKQADDEYVALKEYTTEIPAGTNEKTEEDTQDTSSEAEPERHTPPIEVNFDALNKINPDIVGWIYIGVEEISYPIVQADDNDYYLHRTVEGTENFAGSIFMEYQNSPDFTDPNTIIYGHNMKDLSMFAKLHFLYEYEDYLLDDTFWIITPDGSYEYQMFCIEYTVSDGNAYTLFSGPSADVEDYIAERAAQSSAKLPLGEYDENSKIVTLSTCTSAYGEGRYVVQGILTGVY